MDAIAAAFDAVPRRDFLPVDSRDRAGFDGPIPLGHGQTNSQPRTVADMLRLLDVHPGHRVLDVGAGSGWTTALLGRLVGETGLVTGVEIVPELAVWGEQNVRRTPYAWAHVHLAADGVLGSPAGAPYDRILVSAEADRIPPELLEQLADPGRMVLPVDGRMLLVVRYDGSDEVHAGGRYRFVPLISSPPEQEA